MNQIILEHVTKRFKNIVALNDINIEFHDGEVYGIIGRNGSGKTVLLKAICGLTRVDAGTVTISGKVIGNEIDFPENVGIIIENPGFLPNYSAYNNLKYLASLRNKIGDTEIKNAMNLVGIDPGNKQHVGKFSLGMKQRLGLAQAIMENPDILILDEPMNGLDKNGVVDVRKIILDYKQPNKIVILVSHNSEDIKTLCDFVYEMDQGQLNKIDRYSGNEGRQVD